MRRRQFVAPHFVYPSLDGGHYLRVVEGVDVIVSPSVLAVGREEPAVVQSLERHAEVIALRVQRIARVQHLVFPGLAVHLCHIDVESAHAHVSVAAEIEVAVGAERREHLVARCVDRLTEVFHTAQSCGSEAYAPDVETAHASGHVADKIQPFAIGADGGVGITAQRVACNLQLCSLSPCRVRAR